MDADAIIIRCTRVADSPSAPVPAIMTSCEICHRSVWLSDDTVEQVAQNRPGEEIHATCVQCIPEGDHEVMFLPEQVRDLRRAGATDWHIARTLACMEVANGLTLEQCVVDLLDNPNSVRALAYQLALERIEAFVRDVK